MIAAALVLVVGVSAVIAFRGFPGVRASAASEPARVALPSPREAGDDGPAPVVVGGAAPPPAVRRQAARARVRARTRRPAPHASVRRPPLRSGLSAPVTAAAPETAAPAQPPAAPAPAASAAPDATAPVGQVVDDVKGVVEQLKPAEKVGDALLQLRDALP